MIALSSPRAFYKTLIGNIHRKRERSGCVDFALETTGAVFDIVSGEKTVTYRNDFSYFFGLQIAALKRLRESRGEEVLVSPFGDKIRMTPSRLEISTSSAKLVVADDENGLQQYFSDMLLILKEVQGFLDERELASKSIPEFITDIRNLF